MSYSLSQVDSNSERIMSVSHSVSAIFDVKDSFLLGIQHFRRYIKRQMRYFHSKKRSEFCSSKRFQRRTTFRDIIEKIFLRPIMEINFQIIALVEQIQKRERIMSVSHSVPEIFDVKDSKNALRLNYNHYVIFRACSAYSICVDISKS